MMPNLYEQTAGGVIVPVAFAEREQRNKAPDMREIATTLDGRDITRGYVDPMLLMQSQDDVLRLRGGNIKVYREVLRDDQVKAVFDQRRLAVMSKEVEVIPGGKKRIDKKAADFIKEQIDNTAFDSTTEKMLFGVFYGYSVAEMMWVDDGPNVAIDKIKVRNRERFGFDGAGRLRLKTMNDPNGELLPDRKFWCFQTGADHDDEPYGLGLAHWLYWPAFFKRNGIKFWLIFLEKFGQPTAKGTYPVNADANEKRKLLQALQAIQTDSGIIVPEGMIIELLEAARSGTADYTALYDRMNQAIAKVTLGQTLTTEAVGGQYKAEVQMDVRQDLVKADADLVCSSFNRGPGRWLTDWNYPGAAHPRVWRKLDEEEDTNKVAEREKTIFDMGFKPTLAHITNTYGGEWVEKKNEPTPGADPDVDNAVQFAENDADVVDKLTANLEQRSRNAIDAIINKVRDLLDASIAAGDTPVQFGEKLLDAYPEIETEALTDIMQEALAAAALAGRHDVLDEAGL